MEQKYFMYLQVLLDVRKINKIMSKMYYKRKGGEQQNQKHCMIRPLEMVVVLISIHPLLNQPMPSSPTIYSQD